MSNDATYVCGHCAGRTGSCCVCQGKGRVTLDTALDAAQHVWERPGCACDACVRVKKSQKDPKTACYLHNWKLMAQNPINGYWKWMCKSCHAIRERKHGVELLSRGVA